MNLQNKKLIILADENMPQVEEYFQHLGEVRRLPGRSIKAEDVTDVDILLVRSVTRVDAKLLEGSPVSFVGTATIGTDHLDIEYLEKKGVKWSAAPGCNARSVAEYVAGSVACLQLSGKLEAKGKIGIIANGNVGSKVAEVLEILGYELLIYDPPKEERDEAFKSCQLKELLDCSMICVHAPLTKSGPYPSHKMLGVDFLKRLKKGTVLLSAGRGAVLDFSVLKDIPGHLIECLDVWDPEPEVPLDILRRSYIATPHIAGYSFESKWRGTHMISEQAYQMLNLPAPNPKPSPPSRHQFDMAGQSMSWQELVLTLYNPINDTELSKTSLLNSPSNKIGKTFDSLRKNYQMRHEFSFCKVNNIKLSKEDFSICQNLGIEI
ncbi:MAG: 4-phosphoerythronate dehydrogenase [Planctomycetes bacterium]|nr:4-phosphoerythronate dehydrogenase [Planctomycetota bacterium]